jgi:hypothetical protein
VLLRIQSAAAAPWIQHLATAFIRIKSPDPKFISALSREQKIEILRRWEQDARLMEVAEEESMPGPQPKLLQPIRDALHALNYWPDMEHSGPSKV